MSKVYVVAAKRTAIGSFLGTLSPLKPGELGAKVVENIIKETGVNPANIDEVIVGNVLSAGQAQGVGRQVSIKAGIPYEVPAYSVNIICGSGMKSIITAFSNIKAGEANLVIAGGTESMSGAGFILPGAIRGGHKMADLTMKDHMILDALTDAYHNIHMGITAENIAEKYGITREEQDAFALESQKKAIAAVDSGKFKDEIVPVVIPNKKGDIIFDTDEYPNRKTDAEKLAKLGDAYVNDAFGTAHRAHASTAVIAEFFPQTKFFGLLMAKELEAIDKVLHSGEKPITAILGGSKVSTKITIIENILPVVDNLIIGGGMAFTFIKAQGGNVGNSLVEDDKLDLALEILEKAKNQNVKVYIPVDVIAAKEFNNDAERKEVAANEIPDGWMGLDVGSESQKINNDVIMNSKTILWNGPLGVFEMSNFAEGTKALGDSIAEATKAGAFSLVGGGDSVAFVKQFGYADKVSYVSTGGGAMLESLEGLELPGVSAINK